MNNPYGGDQWREVQAPVSSPSFVTGLEDLPVLDTRAGVVCLILLPLFVVQVVIKFVS